MSTNELNDRLDAIFAMWEDGVLNDPTARNAYIDYSITYVLWRHLDMFPSRWLNERDLGVRMTVTGHEYKKSSDGDEQTGQVTAIATSTRRPFSRDENETLERLYARGKTYQQIAETLDRSLGTIVTKINRLHKAGKLPRRYGSRSTTSA